MPNKLLYITWLDLTRIKGCTTHVNGIVNGLYKLGWRLHLISASYTGENRRADFPFPHCTLGVNGANLFHQLLWQIKLLYYLVNHLGGRPDIIYIRSGKSLFLPAVYAIYRKIPYFIEMNTLFEMETTRSNRFLVPLACFIRNWMIRHATGVFTVTAEIKSFLTARSRQPASKFHVIPNGCDADLCLESRKRLGEHSGSEPIIGFLGSFEPWQGVETVINSLPIISNEIPEVRFWVGGGGRLDGAYRQLCQSLGVESLVSFHGMVQENRILEFMSHCRVMVVPRIGDFDKDSIMARVGASPVKLFTALGAGRPVVVSRLRTFSAFTSCSAVFSADPDDAQEWARVLLEILRISPSMKVELAREALEFIENNYTWDILAQKTARVMEQKVVDRV